MGRTLRALTLAAGIAFADAPDVLEAPEAEAAQRIVNGVETSSHPAVGALLHAPFPLFENRSVSQHNARFACSGTLIGCRTFLTAAHCLEAPRRADGYAVYLQHAGFFVADKIVVHPDYDGTRSNDVAIVKLAQPLQGIAPVLINSTHELAAGMDGTIVGFGRIGGEDEEYNYETGIKRSGHVTTSACDAEVTSESGDAVTCFNYLDADAEPGESSNICDGDFGGPLLVDFNGTLELAGVANDTNFNCLAPSQSIAIDVFHHAAWIASQLEGDSTSTCGAPIGTPLTPVHEETGTVGQAHQTRSLRVPLRADTSRVLVTFNGTEGIRFDGDLFVRRNADATVSEFDCAARGEANFGSCALDNPGEGFLSVLLAAREYAGDFQLTVVESNAGPPTCGNGLRELGESCDGNDLGVCAAGPCSIACQCPVPVCGNGALEGDERYDDGNTAAGDGCDAACVPETADHCEDAPLMPLATGQWVLRGDTTGLDNDYVGCGGKAGDAWFRFSIDAPRIFSAETDGRQLRVLSLYRGNCDGYFLEDCDTGSNGVGPGAAISRVELDAGEYMLVVDGHKPVGEEGPFDLYLSLAEPGCGNDVRETFEGCDGIDDDVCDGLCSPACGCPEPACGNDVREDGEDCDGSDLGGCQAGHCNGDCTCPDPVCGNGRNEEGEQCDGEDNSCSTDVCLEDCTCEPTVCGNGIRESGESCDGSDLGSCLAGPCEDDCECPDPYCGNGVKEQGELCDGEQLGECAEGPCAGDCSCPPEACGNGKREFGEVCDGDDDFGCFGRACLEDCKCAPPACGDGIRQSGEDCDGTSGCLVGSCSEDCQCPDPVCGNGVKEAGEQCDGTQPDACAVGLCQQDCKCPAPVCGNDILEAGEKCDGPNLATCRRGPCDPDCTCPEPVCGNDVRESGEDCDGASADFCPTDVCDEDCTCADPVCGNDVREDGEACDGADVLLCDSDLCDDDCTCVPPVCGDGERQYPEQCDGNDLYSCAAGPCSGSCTCPAPVCGNGIWESGEKCDGSQLGNCIAGPCTGACKCPAPVCGNNVREGTEYCDGSDKGGCLTGPCDPDCTCPAPVCGNGIVEDGESCDGTKRGSCPVNPCTEECTCPAAVCGNNVQEAGEECDGYRKGECHAGPCQQDCTCPPPVCGDDIAESPEECDGDDSYDCDYGCTETCTCQPPVCGNGVAEDNEDCDGADDDNCYDGCDDDCTCTPYCGDNDVNGDEECEEYDADNCASHRCEDDCTCVDTHCGDGQAEGDEQCDGADLRDCPVGPCPNNCRCPKPVCGNGILEAGESCEQSNPGVCGAGGCHAGCACDAGLSCEVATHIPSGMVHYVKNSTTAGAPSTSVGCGGEAGERWFDFSLSRYSVVEASTGGELDSVVTLFAGGCDSLGFVDCNDNTIGTNGSLVGPVVLKPGSYRLVVDGSGDNEGAFTLTVDTEPWDCGDADDNGTVTASDALRVLRKSVGQGQDCPIMRCDPSGDRSVTASDALAVLRTSVGVVLDLYCPSGL